MPDTTGRTVLTFLGRTPPVESERAGEILGHADEYDRPSEYSRRLSMVGDGDGDVTAGAQVMWSDHVPSDLDVTEAEPHLFRVAYDGERVSVGFRTDPDAAPDFVDAVEHVLAVTEIRVEGNENGGGGFVVEFATDSTVDADDVDAPMGWVVEIRPADPGSRVELRPLEGFVLDDSTDPLLEATEKARTVVERL